MPNQEYDKAGNLVECDCCIQNYLLSDEYCTEHTKREPTEKAKEAYRSFYAT